MQSEPRDARITVCPLPFSLAATHRIEFSFSSSPYLDVSVQAVPLHTLWIGVWMIQVCCIGFPHSEISGSKPVCGSPKLIAAYHVFHRLLVPRHPPCALFCLTSSQCAPLLFVWCLRTGLTELRDCSSRRKSGFSPFEECHCIALQDSSSSCLKNSFFLQRTFVFILVILLQITVRYLVCFSRMS